MSAAQPQDLHLSRTEGGSRCTTAARAGTDEAADAVPAVGCCNRTWREQRENERKVGDRMSDGPKARVGGGICRVGNELAVGHDAEKTQDDGEHVEKKIKGLLM